MEHFQLESKASLPGPSKPTPVTVYKHLATNMRFVFVDIVGPQATATIIVPTAEDHTGYTIATAGRDGMAEILPVFLDHVLHPTLRDDQFVTEVYHVDGDGKQQGVVFSEMAARENSEMDLMDLELRRLLYPKTQTYYYECGGLTPEIPKLTNEDIKNFHQKFYHPSNVTILVAGDSLQPERIFQTLIERGILTTVKTDGGVDPIQEMDISKGREAAPIMSKETKFTSRTVHFPSADEDVGSISYGWIGPSSLDVKTMVSFDILFRYLHDTSASPFMQEFVERRNPVANYVDFEIRDCPDSSIALHFYGVPIRVKPDAGLTSHADSVDEDPVLHTNDEDDGAEENEQDEDEDEGGQSDDDNGEEQDAGSDSDEKQDLFEPGYFHSRVVKVLSEFVESGLADPTEMTQVIARHRTKINECIEYDPHESATANLVPDILAYIYLEKDKTKPALIGARSNIFDIIDELDAMEPQYWRDLAKTWLLDASVVEVCMIPDSRLGKVLESTVSQKQNKLREEYGKDGLEKQAAMVVEAVAGNKVNITPEIVAMMPPIPDASKVPALPMSARYVSTTKPGEKDTPPFNLIQVVETSTFFTHVKLCFPLIHLDEDLRPYLVLFQELIFQSPCAIPKVVEHKDGAKEIEFEHLDFQSVVNLVSNTLVSHESVVGFGNGVFMCSWLSELFVLACSAERSKYKEQCQLLLRVLMFTEFTEERILAVAKNLITQIMGMKRQGVDMLAAVSIGMTTPVRGYELATKYCRKMDMRSRQDVASAQLESPTVVLGNDMAISAFRQEPFLKQLVKELKQKTEQ
ncbi:hypothetical protein BGZ94_006666, partial [Podila epigama]